MEQQRRRPHSFNWSLVTGMVVLFVTFWLLAYGQSQQGPCYPGLDCPDDIAKRPPDVSRPTPPPPKPTVQINISGKWRDATGTVYAIGHQGNRFEFGAANRSTGYTAWGRGTINGRQINSTFQTNIPSTGSATGTASTDVNQINVEVNDSVRGQYNVVIFR
jgi:hypothetical protein